MNQGSQTSLLIYVPLNFDVYRHNECTGKHPGSTKPIEALNKKFKTTSFTRKHEEHKKQRYSVTEIKGYTTFQT